MEIICWKAIAGPGGGKSRVKGWRCVGRDGGGWSIRHAASWPELLLAASVPPLHATWEATGLLWSVAFTHRDSWFAMANFAKRAIWLNMEA